MASLASPERLASVSARRPWLVIGVWVALFFIGAGLSSGVGNVLTSSFDISSEPDSVKAQKLMEERIGAARIPTEFVMVRSATLTADDPQFKAFVDGMVAELRQLPTVATVTSYYETNVPLLVSQDRRTVLTTVALPGQYNDAVETVAPLLALVERRDGQGGFEVVTGGDGSLSKAFNQTSEKDLAKAEMIGLPIALVILVLVFGALVAAGVPIVLALVSITVAVGATALVGRFYELSFFVMNMITMIGLAVGIDYSLFIVERFREERRRGRSIEDAITRAGGTASRAVLFSGITVVIALSGMFLVPTVVFRSLAVGAVIVVIVAVAGALTLLPAALRLLGDRVNAVRVPVLRRGDGRDEGGFWTAAARLVMARPWVSVILSTAVLIAAALPYFTIKLGASDAESLPKQTGAYRAFELLRTDFSIGLLAPIQIVIDADDVTAPAVEAAVGKLTAALAADSRFSPPEVNPSTLTNLIVVSSTVNQPAASDEALVAVDDLRSRIVPQAFAGSGARVYVGGAAAGNRDFFDMVDQYTPIVFAFVLSLSFILLLLAFRSIVVPIKAIIMNLLSVGAAYGLLVLVFQHGFAADLFRFQRTPKIDAWIPLFMFSVLFGLSMDYHVFLLSRIRERFDQTGDNAGSVAFGLRSTAGIITGAAAIMVAVFAAFAGGQLSMLEQVGFGLAVAVILDATIVRTVLVPATMELLGARNWYFPRWLEWLPNVQVEGSAEQEPAAPTPARRSVSAGADD